MVHATLAAEPRQDKLVNVSQHQADFLELDCLIGALYGGIGCGKTWAGAYWHILKAMRCPFSIGAIAAGVARTLRETTMPRLREVANSLNINFIYGRDPEPYFGYKSHFERHSNIVSWPNGAQDMIWTLAAGENLRGPEISRFWVDELRLGSKSTWDVFLGRFRSEVGVDKPEGRITSTPSGLDWQYAYFVRDPKEDADAEARGEVNQGRHHDRKLVHGRTAENFALPPWYLKMLLASYDEQYAQQELEGRFIDLGQGMAYYAFNRERNVTDVLPDWWNGVAWWCWSLDFNVDPMAAIIGKHNKATGEVYVFDEVWMRDSNTPDMCNAMAAWHSENGEKLPVHVYGDATGQARTTAGRSDYVIIREAFPQWDHHVPSSNPRVRDRVAAVNGRLRGTDKVVRLKVHPRCRHLIEDMELTQRDDAGAPVKHEGDQDFERKKRTHPSDALGYLVATEYSATQRRYID